MGEGSLAELCTFMVIFISTETLYADYKELASCFFEVGNERGLGHLGD
jgi:hypothetical protein